MTQSKPDKLTAVALSVFRLNGLLIEWGNRFSRPHGLTSARWQVLGAMAMAAEAPTVPQIAAAMGVTRQGVLKQIHLLVEEGLVEPLANPLHKRSPRYALTRRGQGAYRALEQRWHEHVRSLSPAFGAADLDGAVRVLSTLQDLYAAAAEDGAHGE